jgi:hypothetical protein
MLEAALSDEELIGGIELSTLLLADAKAIGLPLAIYTIKLPSDFSMPPSVQRYATDSEDVDVSTVEWQRRPTVLMNKAGTLHLSKSQRHHVKTGHTYWGVDHVSMSAMS